MIHVQKIDLYNNKEEIIPEFSEDFPYLASCAELGKYIDSTIPWHWHNTVELFYMEKGSLEYITSKGSFYFPEGSGGFVNLGTLHSTRWDKSSEDMTQLLHLFRPELLSGNKSSRIYQKYIQPLTESSGIEIIPIHPDSESNRALLKMIRDGFYLSEEMPGYEFQIRHLLSQIWMELLKLADRFPIDQRNLSGAEMKQMMSYIHEHYSEHISVDDIAASVPISRRVCFRVFQEYLHMTPLDYVNSYRLQIATQMLLDLKYSITEIASCCGFGSSSYFSKIFKEEKGYTPTAFRKNWHDCYKKVHK